MNSCILTFNPFFKRYFILQNLKGNPWRMSNFFTLYTYPLRHQCHLSGRFLVTMFSKMWAEWTSKVRESGWWMQFLYIREYWTKKFDFFNYFDIVSGFALFHMGYGSAEDDAQWTSERGCYERKKIQKSFLIIL